MNKIFLTTILFLISAFSVSAVNITDFDLDDYPTPLDSSRSGLWGYDLIKIHNDTIKFLNVSHSLDGTIRNDLNLTLNNLDLTGTLDMQDNNIVSIGTINNVNISKVTTIDLVKLGDITVSATELNFVAGLNSAAVGVNNLSALVPLNEVNPTNATITITESQISNLQSYLLVESNPTNATIQIGTGQVTGLSDFVIDNEVNPTNSTILITIGQVSDYSPVTNDTIQIGTSQVTALVEYIINNEVNPTNDTIQIGTSQVTTLSEFVIANEVNPTNATISIATSQLNDLTASQGKAVCWKTATTLGYCEGTFNDVDGTCTCS